MPCTHQHISCLDRMHFRLEHKHYFQFQEELCAPPSGPGHSASSQQKWPWTTAFQTHLLFFFIFCFFVFLPFSWAAPAAYGGSQARGRIAAGLR